MGCGPKINSTQCNPSQPKAGCMGSCWGDPIVISANVGVIPASFRHIRGSLELVWTNLGVTRGTFGSIWGSFEPSGKSSVQARLGARWGRLGAVGGSLGSCLGEPSGRDIWSIDPTHTFGLRSPGMPPLTTTSRGIPCQIAYFLMLSERIFAIHVPFYL